MADEVIIRLFNEGKTYTEIGEALGRTRNSIAGACRRLGMRRDTSKPRVKRGPRKNYIGRAERAERLLDQRDLDMLCDIDEGHREADVARHWGVSRNYLHNMRRMALKGA